MSLLVPEGIRSRHYFFTSFPPETKARLHVALVLGVLLYGCESWFLREEEFKEMNRFHNSCIRMMLRINLHQQWKRRIWMRQLFAKLRNRVRPLRWQYETRLLRWAGHIARMKYDRLPLMLLTSWVPNELALDWLSTNDVRSDHQEGYEA